MQTPHSQTADLDMPLVRTISRSHLATGLAYLGSYVLLDWVSYVHPFAPFSITAWNPQLGLSFALLLLFGPAFLPWLFVAPLTADLIVRGLPLPWSAEVPVVLITGIGYGAAGLALLSPRLGSDPTLSSKRSLLCLLGIAVASIAVVAWGHTLVLFLHGMVTSQQFWQVAGHAFVGDLIGVMVCTPFLLVAFTRRKAPALSWEFGATMLLIAVALWAVFGFAYSSRFELFYVFFLPVVWIAVRFGLEGVTVGLMVIQVGLIVAVHISSQSAADVIAYQTLLIILAVTGLAVGVLVTEQQRTQQQLRLHQDALHRASRLAAMGEFAAAVAHEINQPLTAIGNYTRLAKRAAEQTPPDGNAAASAASDAIAQVERAGAIVRRLRDFIRLGSIDTAPVAVGTLINETLAICRPELDRYGIAIETRLGRDLPAVAADSLQIEQVLLNLIRNAVEALSQAGRYDGRIVVEAARDDTDRIEIRVTDNGPGFDPDLADQPITPFTTTKSEGLGLGLSLSRSIVEAHGGQLKIGSTARGASVALTLPIADAKERSP